MNKVFIALLICFISCRREKVQELPAQIVQLNAGIRIHDIAQLPDGRIAAVGGQRLESAWYYTSTDQGNTWTGNQISSNSSAYCIHVQNDSIGWIGGDSLKLWKTNDFATWQFQWLAEQVPTHESDRPAIRAMVSQNAQDIYFVGGDYYYKGVAYASHDGGAHWEFQISANALHTISLTDNELTGWGYGNGVQYTNGQWHQIEAPEQDITAVLNGQASSQWAACASGQIYRRTAPSDGWNKNAELSDAKTTWLSGCSRGNYLIFGGLSGELLISKNGGEQWTRYELASQEPIFSMEIAGSQLLCGSDKGLVLIIELP